MGISNIIGQKLASLMICSIPGLPHLSCGKSILLGAEVKIWEQSLILLFFSHLTSNSSENSMEATLKLYLKSNHFTTSTAISQD